MATSTPRNQVAAVPTLGALRLIFSAETKWRKCAQNTPYVISLMRSCRSLTRDEREM